MGLRYATGRLYKKKAVSAGGWWLSGGINPSNCIAAYQPKGAADKTSSLINLANPGIYNAAEGGTLDWNTTNGWIFDGGAEYDFAYINGYTMNTATADYSIIIQLYLAGAGRVSEGRAYNIASWGEHCIVPYQGNYGGLKRWIAYGGNYEPVASAPPYEINIAIATQKAYIDGVYSGDIPTGTDRSGTVYFGNRSNGQRQMNGYIRACALYDTTLTSDQVSALTTAMNAL